MATVLLNGSLASSLVNFRGPFIRAMLAAGHRVHCTAPAIPDDVVRALADWGADCTSVPLARTGLTVRGDLAYRAALRGVIRRVRPDLVVGYTVKPNVWGSLAARAEGVPSASFVTGLGFAFIARGGRPVRRAVQAIARRLYRLATDANRVVIFQNEDDRADFVAAGCLGDPGKARMVNGSGVDVAHYEAAPLPAAPVFLLIARLLWSKGVAEYAQAARAVLAAVPDARVRLAGFLDPGPDGADAADLARWRADGVEFLGALADVRPALADASVYVLPSWREGTPRTVLEAMAMGRPVVTTDAPGCRATVTDGDNGLLVPVRDPAALADAMLALARDPDRRAAMGRRGRAIAEERYDVHRVNAALMAHLGL